MTKFRHQHLILTVDDKNEVVHAEIYRSINHAKRANRVTKYRVKHVDNLKRGIGYAFSVADTSLLLGE